MLNRILQLRQLRPGDLSVPRHVPRPSSTRRCRSAGPGRGHCARRMAPGGTAARAERGAHGHSHGHRGPAAGNAASPASTAPRLAPQVTAGHAQMVEISQDTPFQGEHTGEFTTCFTTPHSLQSKTTLSSSQHTLGKHLTLLHVV